MKPTVLFRGSNGGANWGRASYDPDTHMLYVNFHGRRHDPLHGQAPGFAMVSRANQDFPINVAKSASTQFLADYRRLIVELERA
jgi:hypothetical protein